MKSHAHSEHMGIVQKYVTQQAETGSQEKKCLRHIVKKKNDDVGMITYMQNRNMRG
jgi:hypothetical protein